MIYHEPGDDLLKLFKKFNIETCNINSSVIKAWFDTNCENLLNWICASITEENYVSLQETWEFMSIEQKLSDNELSKELKHIETDFPDLLHYDSNLLEISIAKDTIEVLEEELEHYENQLRINRELNHNLSLELNTMISEEMKSNLERESAQEACQMTAKKLDEINSKSYNQILKYHGYLSDYEVATTPEFINNMEVENFEEKFIDAVTWVYRTVKTDNDISANCMENHTTKTLSKIKNRIAQSFYNCLSAEMESEAFTSILKYLNKYDLNKPSPFIERDPLLDVKYNRSQQNYMLKVIQELSLKQAQYHINQPMIRYSQNNLNVCKYNLNYLNDVEKSILKILSHLVVVYDLYWLEKLDISSSNDFFKNVMQYIQMDLENSNSRKEAMLKVIDEYNTFNTKLIEQKLRIMGNFGTLLRKDGQQSIAKILSEVRSIRDEIKSLENRCFNTNFKVPRISANREMIQDFLTSGPTQRIVTIPLDLQTLFCDVNSSLEAQNSSVQSIMQIVQKTKDSFSEQKWTNERRLLWIYFITDFATFLSKLEEWKNVKHV